MAANKKRARRSPQQMIEDLQQEIERIKTRAAQAKVKKDPALRHISSAVRSIDKALQETKDAPIRKALGEARATLTACLELAGVSPDKGTLVSQRAARVEPEAVVSYLKSHPGSSGEDIAKALGTDTKTLRPAMRKLLEAGQAKSKGKARGMRYFLAK